MGVTWCNCRVLKERGVTTHLCAKTEGDKERQGEKQQEKHIRRMSVRECKELNKYSPEYE